MVDEMEGNDVSVESDLGLEGDNATVNDIKIRNGNIDTQNDNEIANQLSQHYNDINNVTRGNDIITKGNESPKTVRF
eukprot:CAMPEP_0114657770 /NCGR_PEP_ID=MMETSP0191-20121206/14524_1 /TAXON_ID=126664 /ORGANISM="Sorites sp." /LENGTH=76 /DNA_ID=CAMNT_0001878013 /DNA_START=3841 /DNA_END=4071 /DNA_ORIENTATION=+